MDEEKNTAHKLETCGREMACTEGELVEAIIGAAFSQFVSSAQGHQGLKGNSKNLENVIRQSLDSVGQDRREF